MPSNKYVTLDQVLPKNRTKLTEDEVQQIRVYYSQGAVKSRLAKAFGVSRQTIKAIVNNETWKRTSDKQEAR